MYSNDDIQEMITKCNNDKELKKKVLKEVPEFDAGAVESVISEGWYEEFDRYDSAVCEHFINAYERATK